MSSRQRSYHFLFVYICYSVLCALLPPLLLLPSCLLTYLPCLFLLARSFGKLKKKSFPVKVICSLFVCIYVCKYVCTYVHVRWYISFSSALAWQSSYLFLCISVTVPSSRFYCYCCFCYSCYCFRDRATLLLLLLRPPSPSVLNLVSCEVWRHVFYYSFLPTTRFPTSGRILGFNLRCYYAYNFLKKMKNNDLV